MWLKLMGPTLLAALKAFCKSDDCHWPVSLACLWFPGSPLRRSPLHHTVFTSSSQTSPCVVMMQWVLPWCQLSLSLSLSSSSWRYCAALSSSASAAILCLLPLHLHSMLLLSLSDSLLLCSLLYSLPHSLSLSPDKYLLAWRCCRLEALELDWGESSPTRS